jgi:hypothetical protein
VQQRSGDADCPPAPLRDQVGLACNFDFAKRCTYAAPNDVGETSEDTCNGWICACCAGVAVPCTSDSHDFTCGKAAGGCTTKVPVCPSDAIAGQTCAQPNNGECLVLGPGADLSQGIVNGQACACDKPDPIWRCVPAATTKPQ